MPQDCSRQQTHTTDRTRKVKKGELPTQRVGAWRDAARASLREWRRMEACTTFGASPIGPRGILPDEHVEALTFKRDVSSVDDIERKLRDPPWVLVRKYGADVLRILQKIDEEELHRRHQNFGKFCNNE